jgi:hypothetical protein
MAELDAANVGGGGHQPPLRPPTKADVMSRQVATTARRHSGSDRGIARLDVVFALVSAVPLTLLTWSSITLADRAVRQEVNANLRTTSAMSAVFVDQQLKGLAVTAPVSSGRVAPQPDGPSGGRSGDRR